MDESQHIWEVLVACKDHKQYAEFKEFARREPDKAYDLAWRRIVEFKSEIGGGLTYGLLSIMAEIDRPRLRTHIHNAWPEDLDEAHRIAIAACAHDANVLDLSDWIGLYCDEHSSIRVRHAMLSALFGGNYAKSFKRYARACVKLIGDDTDDEVRQQMLREGKAKVLAYYGLQDEMDSAGD